MAQSRSSVITARCLLAGLSLAFFVVATEKYLAWKRDAPSRQARFVKEGDYYSRGAFYRPDPVLGYGLKSNVRVDARFKVKDQVVFDVHYTTDDQGLRVGTSLRQKKPELIVAFFGDSITFGETVEDNESFVSLIESMSNGRIHAINLAVPGYGAHQQLSMLRSGRVKTALRKYAGTPIIAVYSYFSQHIQRTLGMAFWDIASTKYKVTDAGDVQPRPIYSVPGLPTLLFYLGDRAMMTELIAPALHSAIMPKAPETQAQAFWKVLQAIRSSWTEQFGTELKPVFLEVDKWREEGASVSNLGAMELARAAGIEIPIVKLKNLANTLTPWNGHPNRAGHAEMAPQYMRVLEGMRRVARANQTAKPRN